MILRLSKYALNAFIFISSVVAMADSKSYEQKALEVFDSACVRNINGEAGLADIATHFGGKEIDKEKLKFDPVMKSLGGRGFVIPYFNEKYIVIQATSGGCTLIVEKSNNEKIINIITKNYPLELAHTESSGIQITNTFIVKKESTLKDNVIIISFGKSETEFNIGMIGFVTKEALKKTMQNEKKF